VGKESKMPKIKNIKHNGIIDVWNFCGFEEYPKEYGKRIYIDVSALADASLHEIQSNKRYKNYDVELFGVKQLLAHMQEWE
jgi:hypothetical protein